MAGPAHRRRPREPWYRAALQPPGRGDRRGARRRRRRRRDPDRLRQDALLRAPRPAGHRRRPRRPGAVPVPDQGPRPGPGDRVRRAVGRGRAVDHHLDLRRRHAGAHPVRHPRRRPGRREQPGHAPLGDPAPPHQVVPAVRAAQAHRHRRAAHVSRRVRRARRQRPAPAAAHLRPLRQPSGHRVLLRDDREPRRARADAHRAAGAPRRPQRRAVGRAPCPARGPAGHGARQRCSSVGGDPRPALGPAVPARRPPDHRLRAVAGRGRDPPDRPARVPARELRSTLAGARLPGRLPAHRTALRRAGPARRGDPRRRRHQRPRARGRHRPARRGHPRRLPGLGGGDLAADRAGGPAAGDERRGPRRVGCPGGPVRHPPPRVPAREHARGGPPRSGQPARAAGPPARRDLRAPVRARRGVRSGTRRRSPRLPGRGAPRPPGRRRPLVLVERKLPGVRDLAADRGAGERRHHRHDPGPAARPRRGGPVQRPGPRPRARDLHPRVDPVLRGPAGVARAQGLRPPRRRRPLHVREPRGDAQAARDLRRGPRDRRTADPRRGHGREPRDPVQEAQVRHGRERRLGTDRSPGARAPDDRLLADRRGRPQPLAPRRPRRRSPGRGSGDPDHRVRAVDGRPARPGPRDAGSLAPCRAADHLPVRVGAGRHRAGRAPVGSPCRAHRRGGRADRRVPVRRRLSGLHGTASRAGRRREGAGAPVAGRARRRRSRPELGADAIPA